MCTHHIMGSNTQPTWDSMQLQKKTLRSRKTLSMSRCAARYTWIRRTARFKFVNLSVIACIAGTTDEP